MVLLFMKTAFFRARCGAVAAFGALIFSASVSAQDRAGAVALQEVVVTASRFARPVKEVLADVTVIDRQQIEESGATTVLQLLETQPGLQVNFSDNKTGNIYIRGAESRMTGLLIDGVRMGGQDGTSRLGGGVPWEVIPLGDVERIEIVRGPSSVSYGSDAMAGAVQIITRKGEAGVHPFVTMGMGSYNTQTLTAGVRGTQGPWDYAVHAGATQSDGFNTRPDVTHYPDTEGSKNSESGLSLGYQVDSANRLEVNASQNRLQSRYVGYWSSTSQDLVYPNDATFNTSMSSSVAAWEAQWTDSFKTATKWTTSVSRYQDDSFSTDYFTTLDGLSLDANWRALGGNITAYVESKEDRFDQGSAINASRSNSSQGLGYGTKFGPHEVQMNLRSDTDSVFGVSNVGAASYAYQIAPEWRASTSAGNSFRAPTLEQLYSSYGGSTSLAPERGHSLDASLAFSKSGQELKLVIYRNVFDNLITTDANFDYYNVERASVEGVTLSGSKRFTGFRLHGSLDQINPRYEAGTYAGNDLIMRARQVINLGVETTLGEWTLGADVRDVGQTYDDAANTAYKINPASTVLNLRAQTEIAKDWTWSLRINNATDQSYKQSYTGMTYSPGCNFFTTLQWAPK